MARVWLGDDYAGDHAFKGRTDRAATPSTSRWQVAGAKHDDSAISIIQEGRRRPALLPDRHDLRAVESCSSRRPTTASPSSALRGRRRPDGRHADADGTWHVKAGARVRVRLTMVGASRGATTSRSSIRCRPASSR